jgi:hypothetical protein
MRHVGKHHIGRWLAAMLASLSFVAVFACNSVFIPIPPPDPTFTPTATPNEWSVSSGPDLRAAGALYYIYNADLGGGIIQRAATDGSMFATPLHGAAGDRIEIRWEKSPTESSTTICRRLGEGLVVQGCY